MFPLQKFHKTFSLNLRFVFQDSLNEHHRKGVPHFERQNRKKAAKQNLLFSRENVLMGEKVKDFLRPCGPSGFQSSSRQHTDRFQRLRLLRDGRHLDVPVRLLQEWTHFITLTRRFGTFLLTSICDVRQNYTRTKNIFTIFMF